MDVHRAVFWGRNETTSTNSARLELPKKQTKLEIRKSMLCAGVVAQQPELSSEVGAATQQKIHLRLYG